MHSSAETNGSIKYYFKGKYMHSERATVIKATDDFIIVSREADCQNLTFSKCNNEWILEGADSSNNLLVGTQFMFNT